MDWIPAISTSSLLILVLWLFRNLIITRLTNSVKHEYDAKIENLKAELRKNEEAFKIDLSTKASQMEALRNGVLSGVTSRQAVIFERQLVAVEQLWEAFVSLAPAKEISAWMAEVKFESAAKEAAKNPRVREMFSMIGNFDLKNLGTKQAVKTRPFISPLAWAYYSAYEAIVFHAITRLHMLKNGIDMVEVIDNSRVIGLVRVALPHQVQYIEKYGPSAFHYLLEELESNLLAAFRLMFQGEEADKDNLEKAAAIIKQSEALMDANVKSGAAETL